MSILEAEKIWRQGGHNHEGEGTRKYVGMGHEIAEGRIGLEGTRACLGEGGVGEADADVGAVALRRRVHGCDGDERRGGGRAGEWRPVDSSWEAERGGGGSCAAAGGEASSERRRRGRRKGMVVVGEGLRGGGGRTMWVWRWRWARKRRIAPAAGGRTGRGGSDSGRGFRVSYGTQLAVGVPTRLE